MPRRKKDLNTQATVATGPKAKVDHSIGKDEKMQVLAKMLLKCTRKKSLKNLDLGVPAAIAKPPRKPRAPSTSARAVEWQKKFTEIRKQYPGKSSPEFHAALRKAGEDHKRKFASNAPSKSGQMEKPRGYL